MEDGNRPQSQNQDETVQPGIQWSDLDGYWIGMGAAMEWIAMRGQPMSAAEFQKRENEADAALVSLLADMPTALAETMVRGNKVNEDGPLVPIPGGIWKQTATSFLHFPAKPYFLIGADDDDEWDGAILGHRVQGYVRIQIRTDFIRDNWPENTTEPRSISARPAIARAELRRLIEKIEAATPADLAPLTQRELIKLVQRLKPAASRDAVVGMAKDLRPIARRGPKGPRDPDRPARVQKLSDKLIAGQLVN